MARDIKKYSFKEELPLKFKILDRERFHKKNRKLTHLQKIFLLLSLIFFTIVNGQNKILPNDSITPKVIKNHFYPQYSEDVIFIQCGLQDKSGNMWFGSAGDGVYCYDGKSFANYTTHDGLCHNDVLCMLEDNAGNIWFGTRGGVCRYKASTVNEEKNKISSFPLIARSKYAGSNFVWSMLQDKSGKIWFGTTEGVFLFDPGSRTSDEYPVITNFPDKNVVNKNNVQLKMVQKIEESKNGSIWFASGDFSGEGICMYDGQSITSFKPEGVQSFSSIFQAKNGDLFFRSRNKDIYKLDANVLPIDTGAFINYSKIVGFKDLIFTAMLEDKTGNFWFGAYSENREKKQLTGAGVWRYDGKSLKQFATEDGLSENGVNCIVEDKQGSIWFGTRNTGLCRFNGKVFTDYTGR